MELNQLARAYKSLLMELCCKLCSRTQELLLVPTLPRLIQGFGFVS